MCILNRFHLNHAETEDSNDWNFSEKEINETHRIELQFVSLLPVAELRIGSQFGNHVFIADLKNADLQDQFVEITFHWWANSNR